MRKSYKSIAVILGLVIFSGFMAKEIYRTWHQNNRQAVSSGGSNTSLRDRFYEHLTYKSWHMDNDQWFYGIVMGYDDFTPNIGAVSYTYSYGINGGHLSVYGKEIPYRREKFLLALNPFGEMVEISLDKTDLDVINGNDVDEIWEKVVFKKLYRFDGKKETGKYEGHLKCYDNKSRLAYEGSFENGLKQGVWTYYFPTGEKKAELIYEKGRRNGLWSYYNETGKLISTFEWKLDFPVNKPISQMTLKRSINLYPNGNSSTSSF